LHSQPVAWSDSQPPAIVDRTTAASSGWFPMLALICLLAAGGCTEPKSPPQLVIEARQALSRAEFQTAIELLDQVPENATQWNESRLLAGEVATELGQLSQALSYYGSVKGNGSDDLQVAQFSSAEIYRAQGNLTEAVDTYRLVLESNPDDAATHDRLAMLLSLTGQSWEAAPHFEFLVQSGSARLNELVLYADLERPVDEVDFLFECRKKFPDDQFVQLGLAAAAFRDGRVDEAVNALNTVVNESPELLSAQTMLGELLLDRTSQVFSQWHASLPGSSDEHPGIWYVRGMYAREAGRLSEAAFCFRRCLEIMPAHRRAAYQFSQVLVALKIPENEAAVEFSRTQIQLSQTLDDVLRSDGKNPGQIRRVVDLLVSSGRLWEACAWSLWADQSFEGLLWPPQILQRYNDRLIQQPPQVTSDHNLAVLYQRVALDSFSGPDTTSLSETDRTDSAGSQQSAIRFQADEHLLGFTYFNGDDPDTPGVRMFEQTGGGVAVIDFDLDGFPDIFLPQGKRWPTGSSEPDLADTRSDALMRNIGGTGFHHVSPEAALVDAGFGQGCAVGDFDSDGFPDLYVAHVGRNTLLLNNGDGTWSDATQTAGISAEDWTTSVLMTDLNADGHPDLFDVGYVTGPDVYQRICGGKACSPSNFAGSRDRVHINSGSGAVVEIPDATPESNSKGLGILTLFDDNLQRPTLFIANDQVANHLLRTEPGGPQNLVLRETALISGVAFNEDGLSMACMGIAAEDVNHDRRLDVFVTNFHDETNTLYIRDSTGLFTDRTRLSGLAAPSLPYVGWGTQFLDADLDGQADLVVTNGHVDDYRDEGGQYQMRPQLYQGLEMPDSWNLRPPRLPDFSTSRFPVAVWRDWTGMRTVEWTS